jgi:hypothetical protein
MEPNVVDCDPDLIARKFEKEVNNNIKNPLERQLAKKRATIIGHEISKFFGAIDPYKKDNVHQKEFLENLSLLVMKSHLPIQFVESMWLKCIILQLCPRVIFPSKKMFNQKVLHDLVEETKQTYVLLEFWQSVCMP